MNGVSFSFVNQTQVKLTVPFGQNKANCRVSLWPLVSEKLNYTRQEFKSAVIANHNFVAENTATHLPIADEASQ